MPPSVRDSILRTLNALATDVPRSLLPSLEQSRVETAEADLRMLGNTSADIFHARNIPALDALLATLLDGLPTQVRLPAERLAFGRGTPADRQLLEREAAWLLNVTLPDGTPLFKP
jgi:hypothetical protein